MAHLDNDYIFLFETFIINSIPGSIYLGHLTDATINFYIPILQDEFLYLLGKNLFAFIASDEDTVSFRCGQLLFELRKNCQLERPEQKITMSYNEKGYTFQNDLHVLKFLRSIPIMACKAAVVGHLFRPLVTFCHHLSLLDEWLLIIKRESQFGLGSTILWDLLQTHDDHFKTQILVFIEINYQFIVNIIRLQKVVHECK